MAGAAHPIDRIGLLPHSPESPLSEETDAGLQERRRLAGKELELVSVEPARLLPLTMWNLRKQTRRSLHSRGYRFQRQTGLLPA